jgi:hypothetical protein
MRPQKRLYRAVLGTESISPRIFSVICLPDKIVIRGRIAGSAKPLDLILNIMIRNMN